jgi:pimeloyl-ACP methyl ester carboxylesterase
MKGVVFLHAFPYSPRMWEAEMALLKTRLPVLAPHYLGLSLEEAAKEVLAGMEEMGLERAVFVGLSMGGYLIFELFRKAPERFLGVVLSSTRAGPDSEEARRNRYALRERVLKEGVGFLPEVLLPGHLGRTTRETKPKVVEKAKELILEASPKAVAESLKALAERPDSTPLLPRMEVPPWSWWARRTPSPPRRRPKRCGRPSPTGAC